MILVKNQAKASMLAQNVDGRCDLMMIQIAYHLVVIVEKDRKRNTKK